LEKDWLKYTTGVVPAISTVIRKLTSKGDKVLIQTPVYHVFFYIIEDNEREVIENKLIYKDKQYSIDFDDLEEKLSMDDVKLMLLCNPHNPIGKIWSKEELKRIGQLCKKHDVVVVADEIHGDLTDHGRKYNPFINISEECRDNTIMTIAPTKTFNIAGLKTAAVCIPNSNLREKIFKAIDVDCINDPNIFAVNGTIAAYTKGGEWLNQLRQYLYDNKQALDNYLKNNIPEIELVPSDATYLLWIDCSRLGIHGEDFCDFLNNKTGLLLSPGIQFGKVGEQFVRINIACPRKLLLSGLDRLKRGVELYKNR
ncbi:MAG: MalY/PatB family protein, partial [Methanosphaera sp.]